MTAFISPAPLAPYLSRIHALAHERGLHAYVVGGTVRDVLLGREMRDLDVAVDRGALAFARAAADAFGGHFVELDDANAIARVVLDDAPLDYIDVAQLQGTLEQDLRRRDFTVDAMAVPLPAGDVVDPLGGLADLDRGLVRMTSPRVLDDDPLRLLRAVRIASELGFAIEDATMTAVRERAARVNDAAAERRRDELARIFALDAAYGALRLLDECGLLDRLLPELAEGRGVTQPDEFHAYDVFEHGLRTVEALDVMLAPSRPPGDRAFLRDGVWDAFAWCEPELRAYLGEELSEGRTRAALLKLAGLLHDVAKPATRTVDPSGRIRFFGHADEGAAMASGIMRRLRFSSREGAFVATLVAQHLRPVQLAQVGEAPTRRALYRFFRDLGDAVPAVLLLSLADAAGARGPSMTPREWRRHAQYMNSLLVRYLRDEGIVHPPRLLNGHDIMSEFGIAEGPLIGELLGALEEATAAGEVRDREGALAFVRARLA